jgi:transcriptional regulator with XRE-family HTH domain
MARPKRRKEDLDLARGVGSRLVEIREGLRLSQQAFIDKLEKGTQRSLANYERGEALVPADLALRICDVFNLNFAWLMTGVGPMKRSGYSVRYKFPSDPLAEATLAAAERILTAGTNAQRGALAQFVYTLGDRFPDPKLSQLARVRPQQVVGQGRRKKGPKN